MHSKVYHISEMTNEGWINTSFSRLDGKIEFRERPQFGNTHVIFPKDSEWGEEHIDKYNALDFPTGTVDHLAKYTEEKTNIPETIAGGLIVVGGLILGAKLLQYLED